jgi:hypothetical protein
MVVLEYLGTFKKLQSPNVVKNFQIFGEKFGKFYRKKGIIVREYSLKIIVIIIIIIISFYDILHKKIADQN